MFKQAVQQHTASGPPRKPAPRSLSQTLFPSSSPPNAPSTGARKGSTLAPNPSAANIQPSAGSRAAGAVLKRSATDIYQSGNKPSIPQASSASGTGLVGMLHNSVNFDENDFVNDDEIDLDEECDIFPAPKRLCTDTSAASLATKDEVQYPTVQVPVNEEPPPPPQSTVLYPWSSSPAHHKLPPPQIPGHVKLAAQGQAQAQAQTDVSYPSLPELEPEIAVKRRKLPWMENGEEAAQEEGLPKAAAKPRRGRPKGAPTMKETPARAGAKAPWNMSASAMKAEQQKHRNSNKRIKETTVEDLTKGRRLSRKGGKPIVLSEEQSKVLGLVAEAKKSVFFTGSAGTGKSVLMREIIKALKDRYAKESDRVAVTASTGLAACNIGGVTLHSFGGIGLGKDSVEVLVKKIKKNQKNKNRWHRTKVLIIDEISMIDGKLFDKLEKIARIIRNNARPFGGIQLVVTGDFFQLPPVPDQGKVAKFAFEAGTWSTSIEHTIGLTQIFRQRDPEFASMLNEMRIGRLSQKTINTFYGLSRKLENIKGEDVEVQATELFPLRGDVDRANTMRLSFINGDGTSYDAVDGGAITDPTTRERLLANCIAPARVTLKKGAQVMLIKNFDEHLVNGSIGQVIGFMDEKKFEQTHRPGDELPGSSTGGGPTGASSSWSDDDEAWRLGDSASISRAQLQAMVHRPTGAPAAPRWPVVRFPMPGGGHRDLLCQRESWKVELPNGEVQASRSQVPLILAWALSIHKAQGQTLECVKVDLGKIFEKGQAYVALSRATTQEGLQVLGFNPKKVMAHDKVRAFYDSLYNVDKATARVKGDGGLQKYLGMKDVDYPLDLDDFEYGQGAYTA